MSYQTLLYEVNDGVATVTLNRPTRHNTFNLEMARELRDVWRAIHASPDVVCAILTGAGERTFCGGIEIGDVAEGGETTATRLLPREEAPWCNLTALQNKCWKPVITAVNGSCVGGGLHFLADSDLTVAAEHATFFDPHVKSGLIAGLEPVGLTRRIPLEAVLRIALLGGSERMTAQQALSLGLVGEVVPSAELMPRARALASKIAAHSPTALALTKKVIWESLDVGLDEALSRTWDVLTAHNDHPDFVEGPQALIEKRRPRWKPYTG